MQPAEADVKAKADAKTQAPSGLHGARHAALNADQAASSAQQSLAWLLAVPPESPAPPLADAATPAASGPLREHRHPLANREIELAGVRIGFHHAHAKRRSIGMSVGPQGLQVRAPRWVTQAQLQAVLRERAQWIVDKLQQQLARVASEAPAQRWGAGHTVPVLGRAVLLRAQPAARAGRSATAKASLVRLGAPSQAAGLAEHDALALAQGHDEYLSADQQKLAVSPDTGAQQQLDWIALATPADEPALSQRLLGEAATARADGPSSASPNSNAPASVAGAPQLALDVALPADAPEAQWQAAVLNWLHTLARRHFTARLDQLAPVLGVRWSRLSLTNARTRWGSASTDGSIRLHWRLMQLAPELADYVIVHELAHLHEMNHSPRFWAIVEAAMPDYARHQQALKQIRLAPLA